MGGGDQCTSTCPSNHYNSCTQCVCINVATLALGSRPRQRLVKVRAKREAQESHFMFPGGQRSAREWTHTLPKELPLWELESWWTSESLESNCRGQNSFDWIVSYIIAKILKCRCLKWACMTHFGHLKYKLWSKERSRVKLFDSRPLKVKNRPDFLACRWHATYHWKSLD
jgi:hypothetical protein